MRELGHAIHATVGVGRVALDGVARILAFPTIVGTRSAVSSVVLGDFESGETGTAGAQALIQAAARRFLERAPEQR